ncbi:hypothetical protein ZIOFF_023588 [Zingiber officinale]|uniref:Suppressor of forked domain-containing protein n=1 Tax=Zingiber officinale TaxID=94328 RepID=A0A8J5HAT0_ZINOF|nr:hypothetical protein ZIOFF_023588 [Zingiber officinale]
MYLYHYPDIWYDYATWHASSGSVDSAAKVFQRALKALPDSELLKYAYAELEESRGAIQSAKKIYESFLVSNSGATSLAQIQYIRFLRRSEGIEAARKYFLDARKSPSCTYHVFVAYATVVFCVDKDSKVAHNIFEAGLKRFMNEPGYILEYADFLCRLNDDRNVRALFERALSSLPPEKSVEVLRSILFISIDYATDCENGYALAELMLYGLYVTDHQLSGSRFRTVWKGFSKFEQTYGDLVSMLKVEQRRKEALSQMVEEGSPALENTLYDVISRYSFMDLWPCSSKDLDHLSRQEMKQDHNVVVELNLTLMVVPQVRQIGPSMIVPQINIFGGDKVSAGLTTNSKSLPPSSKVVYPDTSRMVIYDPRQTLGSVVSATPWVPSSLVPPPNVRIQICGPLVVSSDSVVTWYGLCQLNWCGMSSFALIRVESKKHQTILEARMGMLGAAHVCVQLAPFTERKMWYKRSEFLVLEERLCSGVTFCYILAWEMKGTILHGMGSEVPASSNSTHTSGLPPVGNSTTAVSDILKLISPVLATFITNLPVVEEVLPVSSQLKTALVRSPTPTTRIGKPAVSLQQMQAGPGPSTSDLSGSTKTRMNNGPSHKLPRDEQSGKRKYLDRQEDDESTTEQSRPLPKDVFRLRQMHRSRGLSTSQTGSAASGGSVFSGEPSVSISND